MIIEDVPVAATDVTVIGVNQAQRLDSVPWHADLQPTAEATQRKKP